MNHLCTLLFLLMASSCIKSERNSPDHISASLENITSQSDKSQNLLKLPTQDTFAIWQEKLSDFKSNPNKEFVLHYLKLGEMEQSGEERTLYTYFLFDIFKAAPGLVATTYYNYFNGYAPLTEYLVDEVQDVSFEDIMKITNDSIKKEPSNTQLVDLKNAFLQKKQQIKLKNQGQ